METLNERVDYLHIIVTVLKTKNKFRILKNKPKSLEANEYCISLRMSLDKREWFNRIKEYSINIKAPNAKDPGISLLVGPDVPTRVLKKLQGKDAPLVERNILKEE